MNTSSRNTQKKICDHCHCRGPLNFISPQSVDSLCLSLLLFLAFIASFCSISIRSFSYSFLFFQFHSTICSMQTCFVYVRIKVESNLIRMMKMLHIHRQSKDKTIALNRKQKLNQIQIGSKEVFNRTFVAAWNCVTLNRIKFNWRLNKFPLDNWDYNATTKWESKIRKVSDATRNILSISTTYVCLFLRFFFFVFCWLLFLNLKIDQRRMKTTFFYLRVKHEWKKATLWKCNDREKCYLLRNASFNSCSRASSHNFFVNFIFKFSFGR